MARSARREERIRTVLAHRQPDLTVVMENIHDPHNVSAMLRSCDAVGIMRVELLYTVERFPAIGRKSSSSASKWIERRRHTDVVECMETLRTEGYRIYATHLEHATTTLFDLDLTGRSALVFGNEHRGVSNDVIAHADSVFRIPMFGMIQSLNVSVACAVCLYEALRQRMHAGHMKTTKLDRETLVRLYDEWIKR